MKNIILIGTGGLAAELTNLIEDKSFGEELQVKGYLATDDGHPNWQKYHYTQPYLGNLYEYKFVKNDYFVVAIANVNVKLQIINYLKTSKANLINLIHSSVIISNTAKIGEGNMIYPYCIIGPNVIIGNFNILTSQSIISHDCVIGDNNFLPTALLAGNITVGDNNTFGIRCTSIPCIVIGNNTTIKAGMLIDKNVTDGETVFYKYKEKIIALPKDI